MIELSDQEQTERAYKMLAKTMKEHPEVDKSIWRGACWTALMTEYLIQQMSYEELCDDIKVAKTHYRKWCKVNGGIR